MNASSNGVPFISGVTSLQSICAFLNRFEKELENDVVDAGLDEIISCEMEIT